MIYLIQNKQDYNDDIRVTLMAFYHGVKIVETLEDGCEVALTVKVQYEDDVTDISITEGMYGRLKDGECGLSDTARTLSAEVCGDYRDKQTFKNIFKKTLYKLLCEWTKTALPWGDLTGVRPTKLAMAMLKEGADIEEAVKNYEDTYLVSERKAQLAAQVAEKEIRLTERYDFNKDYCLYFGIPFCPSKCLYCSFTSYPIALYRDKAVKYVEKLKEELSFVAEENKDKHLAAIYMGGGTPTSIDHELLDDLLAHVNRVFGQTEEFTVEAGRPDSITREKLVVLKKNGVTRISINPQTMNDETLKTIGRAHNSSQIKEAFNLARECGFDNINMDLIAGLPGETISHMRYTLDEVARLNPDSITVHSLAIKRAANLKQQMETFKDAINKDMDAMLDLVQETAGALSMEPYYLYRQKNIGGNLENVGYAKVGKECLYNILIMEELLTIAACGAGTVTKRVYPGGRIERCDNVKDVDLYISRFDEMIERKRRLFAE